MTIPFRIFLVILILSIFSYGQSHQILKETIEVDENTALILNFENIYVALEESTDGKIHFDYVIEFEGFSKKDIQKKLEGVSAKVSNSDNRIILTAKSENKIAFESFELKTDYGISYKANNLNKKRDSIIQKSKDSLLSEIKLNTREEWSKNPLKFVNNRFKKVDKNGKLTNIRKRNISIMRSQFVIKIPPFVTIEFNSKSSSISLRNDLRNEVSGTVKIGALRTKELMNPYNRLKVDNANFESNSIRGGYYNFVNVKNGKIGTLGNATIESEFSEIEIGEINGITDITDFNSEYWLYNWSNNFELFNLYSSYSKIHFFYPETNHSLKVIGSNTKNLFGNGDVEINMQPTSKGEKYLMMERKPKGEGNISGNIHFDIVHGIIYSHNDSIKSINKD